MEHQRTPPGGVAFFIPGCSFSVAMPAVAYRPSPNLVTNTTTMNGAFHLAFATTDLKRIKAFYGKFLGLKEGRSAETWVDYDFFGHQLTIQEVPKLIRTARIYNPKSNIPSDHWGIVLPMADWKKLRAKFVKVGAPFFIEPRTVMKGEVGEQVSMFIEDPDGHAIEFKAFTDPDDLFRSA